MTVFDNMNFSTDRGLAPGVVEYYERTLLRDVTPEMLHSRDGQKRRLPENNGRVVHFRKFTPFPAMTRPLTEGVTPDGQKLEQTTFASTVKPYGAHVELTDETDLYHLDNIHQETARLLRDQATLTLDTLARDVLHSGLNVQYANGKTERGQVEATDILTAEEIKKAVRTLERNNCKPFDDGYYHAIISPDTKYDITSDPLWVDIAKYQNQGKVERYELGKMFKVKFYEGTRAKTWDKLDELYYQSDGTAVTELTGTAWDPWRRELTISEQLSPDEIRKVAGMLVNVSAGGGIYPVQIEYAKAYESAAHPAKVILRWQPEGVTDADMASAHIGPTGTGLNSAVLQSTLIYGPDAYGTIELGGGGKNVSVIMKPAGSSGALDPLNQRATVAWKVRGFTTVILQQAFMVRIEHGATE